MDIRQELLSKTRVPKEYWPPADAWPSIEPTRMLPWEEYLNLADILLERNLKQGRGQKGAIFFQDQAVSYEQLARMSAKLANSLKRLGIISGDRVAIRMTNSPEFIVSDMALQKIGAIVVPLFVLLKAPSIAHILQDAEVRMIIVDAGLIDEVEKAGIDAETRVIVYRGVTDLSTRKNFFSWERLLEAGEENITSEKIYCHDAAMIHYTSGTTGAAKGCIQTPLGLLGHVGGTVDRAGIREDDVLAVAPPLPFAYGHAAVIYTLTVGCSCILLERFTVEEFLSQAERRRATVLVGIPTLYRMMLSELPKYDLSSVRLLMTAGETFTAELESSLQNAFPKANFFNFYGYTEMWNFIGTVPGVHSPTSLGIPYDEYKVSIVDEQTRAEVGVGQVGAITASGAAGALYWRLPEKQKSVIKNGMFYSGDLAYRDEQGVIWFKARDMEIIKSSGYLISPYEIEDKLGRHPAVAMVGCIGIPDAVKGEIIKAFIKLKAGYQPSDKLTEELERFATEALEKYKVPKAWEFIDDMPVTASGKTLRRGLKERELTHGT